MKKMALLYHAHIAHTLLWVFMIFATPLENDVTRKKCFKKWSLYIPLCCVLQLYDEPQRGTVVDHTQIGTPTS